jgi:universal stress protein E
VSPVPVLLVRNNKTYASPVILAALDPLHAAGKPAHLDAEILAAATSLQKALKGSIHAVHAYLPSRVGLQPSEMRRDDLAEHLEDRARTRAQRAVAAELKAAKVKGATIHLVPRHPEDAIPAAAHKTRAAITVMGAISRSGLKRLFIGNTAEQVIQALRSDVLIIKPRRFAKLLQQRARGADIRPLALPDYV